jgi:hypothetical protein
LLKDKALVVRSEAVTTVHKLKLKNSTTALIESLELGANYHGGRAQKVPQKALIALADLGDASIAGQLLPLLKHDRDPELQLATLSALEKLTSTQLESRAPLKTRILAWQKKLAKR